MIYKNTQTARKIFGTICLSISSLAIVTPTAIAETFSIGGMALNTNSRFPLKDNHPIMSIWPLTNDNDQRFDRRAGDLLQHFSTGKCLNAYQPTLGSKVNVYPCDSNDGDQKFAFIPVNGNTNLIKRIGTNLCLDMPNRNSNTQIILWDCNSGNANQQFVSNASNTNNPVPTPSGDSLTNNNSIMRPGTSLSSNNQCFQLAAQTDGNLVLYRKSDNKALWNSSTYGRSVKHTIFQTDGNLVIYDPNNNPIWNTGTYGRGATRLTIQNDGNLVMYNSQNQPIWATNTVTDCNNNQNRDVNAYYLPWQAGYSGRVDQAWYATVAPGGIATHGPTPLALDFTVEGNQDVPVGNTWRSIIQAAAVRSGVVEQASNFGNVYGNTVIIRHDDGTKSQYSHLYNINVSAGQRVNGGQNLGFMGMTGLTRSGDGNGVHLHFQMMDSSNKMIRFGFKDAPNANFNTTGLSYTSQNR
jgi:hypothetical protein